MSSPPIICFNLSEESRKSLLMSMAIGEPGQDPADFYHPCP